MTLQIVNPTIASRSCDDCRKYLYDLKSGILRKDHKGNPKPRPAGTTTPCDQCPKISPDREWEFRLNWRSVATIELYYASKATGGACLGDLAVDPITMRNFAHVERILSQWQATAAATKIVPHLMNLDPNRA